MAEQLAFDLALRPALGRADFFTTPSNALALAQVDGWRHWPQGKLVLAGPAGSGKTHLVHLWADETRAAGLSPEILPAAELALADIPALAAGGAVAVEDADAIAGYTAGEAALFHLHNLVLAEGGRLLVTAHRPPLGWALGLADLASRMQASALAQLQPPDDALLSAVLVKLFADRQLAVPAALIPWLVARMDRSLAAARDMVGRLDAAALASGRPIGRALAQAILAQGDSAGDGVGDLAA